MKTVRLFTGTYADPEIFRFLYRDMQKEFKHIAEGKWVEPENLHFTYKFIGDFNTAFLAKLKEELLPVLKEFRSPLIFSGLSCFPNDAEPRVLHMEIQNPDGTIQKIFNQIESVTAKHGIPREKRVFKPHLTLMRIKSSRTDELKEKLESFAGKEFGAMEAFKVDLIESKLYPTGPVYRVIG